MVPKTENPLLEFMGSWNSFQIYHSIDKVQLLKQDWLKQNTTKNQNFALYYPPNLKGLIRLSLTDS